VTLRTFLDQKALKISLENEASIEKQKGAYGALLFFYGRDIL
jgi:hypothetical protein